jgi:hypothetical protein
MSTENVVIPAVTPTPRAEARWEGWLRKAVTVLARVALAYLFFTQLWWKMPPNFGCGANLALRQETANGGYTKTTGLCTWLGYESIFAKKPREFFVADLIYWAQSPVKKIAVDGSAIARLNGQIIDDFIAPNLSWFGYVIFWSEAFIVFTLFFGVLTRLGGLVALGVSTQLAIGLSGIAIPGDYEWEWAYWQMVVLSLLMIGLAPGRWLGIDALIRRALKPAADRGNALARLLLLPT